MKINILFLNLLLAAGVSVQAQPYRIDSFCITGGAGISTGGVFSVSGTVGQPEAGALSGGSFSLGGGFWTEVSDPQLPPFINIERLGEGRVRVSWPLPESGYVLYHSLNLGGWAPLPAPFDTNATHLSVIRSERAEFFFLRKP